jgi:lipoprotein NlpI
MRLNPKDPEAPFNRGISYLRLGKYDYAARDFTEVIQTQPRNANAHVYRGIARIYQDREKDADGDFQKAFQLEPQLKQNLQPLINEAKENAKKAKNP